MNPSLLISRFLYRIRYQLLFGSLIVALLVAYFSRFIPPKYTVDTIIYTGIISSSTEIDGDKMDYTTINNTYDNLINLISSRSTLRDVSLHLFAINMIRGNLRKDNEYITAEHFTKLLGTVPDDVKSLIDKNSIERTVSKLSNYERGSTNNYLYRMLNDNDPYYSYSALSKVTSSRMNNSDMIKISYQSNDPGITTTTVKLVSETLLKAYDNLRYKSTDDAISYFKNQVQKYHAILYSQEDALTNYNITNNIINYDEQTKSTASSYSNYLDRYEEITRKKESAEQLLRSFDKHMNLRAKSMLNNKDFLSALKNVTDISGKAFELQWSAADSRNKSLLSQYNSQLKQANQHVSDISTKMDLYKHSKEGVSLDDMVKKWLDALVDYNVATSELAVLDRRKAEFEQLYKGFSPIGTNIKRMERDINVSERTYLEFVDALNTAYLKRRNIQLTTAGLQSIAPPSFPLSPDKGKRMIIVLAALFGSLFIILIYHLIIELLDRTLRDSERSQRLTKLRCICSFSGHGQLRYRGFSKTWNRKSAMFLCNWLNSFLTKDRTAVFNIISIEQGEGKSYVSKFMLEEWEREGLNVKHLTGGNDFPLDSSYIYADNIFQLIPEISEGNNYDIIVCEFPALQTCGIPTSLLNNADQNIIVANACRVWKNSDDEIIKHLKEVNKKDNISMCLNNTIRDVVEDFTGELPPFSRANSLSSQMKYMGLTASQNYIK